MTVRIIDESTEGFSSLLAISRILDQEQADYLLLGRQIDVGTMARVERVTDAAQSPDIVVVFDSNDPARSSSMREELPPRLSLIAASAVDDPAVALSVKAIRATRNALAAAASMNDVILRVAEGNEVMFVEAASSPKPPVRRWLSLAMPSSGPRDLWLRDFIGRVQVPGAKANNPDLAALRAGLYLLNDFFDESHSCSQSMEGHPNADYWHAILHRREPDYGNAKYWFRHVGRHPIFDELASQVETMWLRAIRPVAAELEPWKLRLITSSGWDPFAFVDLCSVSAADPDLRSWCEEVQFREMLLLLPATCRDATA